MEIDSSSKSYNHYQLSTHKKNWILSQEKIAMMEKDKFERGFIMLIEIFENNNTGIGRAKHYAIKPEQENSLINYFLQLIIKECNKHKFSTSLKLTVLTIFKRFFLKKLSLDFDIYFVVTITYGKH